MKLKELGLSFWSGIHSLLVRILLIYLTADGFELHPLISSQCSTLQVARRTGFKEQYYTDTRRYICVREDCRQYPGETIYKFVMVYHQYLRIAQFVWARVLCGTRYYQSASLDCSLVIQKIHMREPGVRQGQST